MQNLTQSFVNDIAYKIVGCAIEVHKSLGPGLLESIYHTCLAEEMTNAGLQFVSQRSVPVIYKGKLLNGRLKLDFLVDDLVIVELKAIEGLLPLHRAQLLSYLRLV